MIKRILVAFGGIRANPGTNYWAADIARRLRATVTVVPLMDADALVRLMPAVITTGYAARVLESQPWDVTAENLRELRQQCEAVYETASVGWGLVNPGDAPWEYLLSETRFHDLLILGLDDAYDPVIVPNFMQASGVLLGSGAAPLLCVPPSLREIRKVLIAFSGTAASSRALKRYVHSDLWSDASIEVVCQNGDRGEAASYLTRAEQYLAAHGRDVRGTAIGGRPADLCIYAMESGADLIVAGSSHRNRLGIATSSEVLRGFLGQTLVPVFIAGT
ncbi:MAG: universal stress protein [Bryobacterales bacterium]|nr:universal stress protein [Bryobacterales bacterium]